MTASPISDADPLCRMDARALAQGFAQRAFSPVEVARAALARCEAVQAGWNAFVLIAADEALAAAQASEARWLRGEPLSPLDGVPTTVKDIVWVREP